MARRRGGVAVGLLGILAISGPLALASLPVVGPTIRVSTTGPEGDVARGASAASVAFNPQAGEYLAVWQSEHIADQKLEIYGQRISAAGVLVGENFRISTTGLNDDPARDAVAPAVAYSPDSNEYLAVWRSDALATDGEQEIFAQRIGPAGVLHGANFRVSVTGSDGDATRLADRPAVAYNAKLQEYLVSWDAHGLAAANELEVFGQRLSAVGTPQAGNFRISFTGDDGDAARAASAPQAAADPQTGEWLVAWQADALVAGKIEIFGQRLGAGGLAQGSNFRISTTRTDADLASAVGASVGAGDGGYLVSWQSNALGSDEVEIFAQRIGGAGALEGANVRVSFTGAEGDTARSAALSRVVGGGASGEYLVVWEGDGLATDNENEIFGQRVAYSGALEGANFRVSTTWTDGDAGRDAAAPDAAFNPAGEFLVVDTADGLGTPDEAEIFGQRLKAADPPPAAAPPATPAPASPARPVLEPLPSFGPAPAINRRAVRVSRGRVAIRLTCPARGLRCAGRLRLQTAARVPARLLGRGRPARTVTLGSASYSIASGRTAAVRVVLSSANRRILRRLTRTRARASAHATSGSLPPTTSARTITVRGR